MKAAPTREPDAMIVEAVLTCEARGDWDAPGTSPAVHALRGPWSPWRPDLEMALACGALPREGDSATTVSAQVTCETCIAAMEAGR